MDWKTSRQYLVRALPKTEMGKARVHHGAPGPKFNADEAYIV